MRRQLYIADLGNNRVRKVTPDGRYHDGGRHGSGILAAMAAERPKRTQRAAQRGAR